MQATLETIDLFKTRPDVVAPSLQDFLRIDDGAIAADIQRRSAPLFPPVPKPALAGAMPALHQLFAARYPASAALAEADIADDASFAKELERNGFVTPLYAGSSGS